MPLFSKAVVKMDKGCSLTDDEWVEAVKKQDKTDARIESKHEQGRVDLVDVWGKPDPDDEEVEHIVQVLTGGEDQYADSDKSWEEIRNECE
jgi:predicted aconitase